MQIFGNQQLLLALTLGFAVGMQTAVVGADENENVPEQIEESSEQVACSSCDCQPKPDCCEKCLEQIQRQIWSVTGIKLPPVPPDPFFLNRIQELLEKQGIRYERSFLENLETQGRLGDYLREHQPEIASEYRHFKATRLKESEAKPGIQLNLPDGITISRDNLDGLKREQPLQQPQGIGN